MAIKWSPGCVCCGISDPCEVTTITNEANGTNNGLAQYMTLGTHTSQELTDLATNKELADGMGLLSTTDVITSIGNWSWKVLLEGVWSYPAKYRIISQATYSGGSLTDHIFGEVEILADASASMVHVGDWPVRIALGKIVGGVETILDETYFQNEATPNTTGPIFPYPATMVLCRGTDYTHFFLGGEGFPSQESATITYEQLWANLGYPNETAAFIVRENPSVGAVTVGDRTLKDGDIIHFVDAANYASESGWTVYREIDASVSPTFTTVGDGLVNGDYVFPSAAGTVVNAGDPGDTITVALNESIEVTDDTQITSTAGWTLRTTFDPTAGTPFIAFTVSNTDKIETIVSDGLNIKGTDATGTPTGYKVGVSCEVQGGNTLTYGGGTYRKILTLDTPTCDRCERGFEHCPCDGSVEQDVWVSHSSSFDFLTNHPTLFDQQGWYYLHHSETNSKIYRWKRDSTAFGGSNNRTDSLCSFIFQRVARYYAPSGYYSKTYPRLMDLVELVYFEAFRQVYDFSTGSYDEDRIILRSAGNLFGILFECCNPPTCQASGSVPSLSGLDPDAISGPPDLIAMTGYQLGSCALGGYWAQVSGKLGVLASYSTETETDTASFDCENFSFQGTYATVTNNVLDPQSQFNAETSTWAQA